MLALPRTLVPSVAYYLTRPALPTSPKPALFTMNILPPMMTVWHHLVRKNLGDNIDVTVFDCSGRLNAKEFPEFRIQKFLNLYASVKSDEFLYHIAKHRKVGWICDDDVFFLSPNAVQIMQRELAVPNTASVSFRPRNWWHYEIDGKQFEPSGSYCIAFNREIICEKERLTLAPADGNTHPTNNNKGNRRYDTGDLMNEKLLRKGYRCAIVPEHEREQCTAAFTGLSGAVILLNYFKRPEDVMSYFLAPADGKWSGTFLYGVLCAMLSISTIQELYTTLKGHPYPLPSLPSRTDLEKLRREKLPLIGQGRTFEWVDATSEKLRAAL